MNILEIIELRSSSEDNESLRAKLTKFIDDLNKDLENYRINLYRQLTIKTDWSVHIHVQTDSNTASPSPLGLRIAAALKEIGLVHHGIWSEVGGRKK